MCYFLVFLFIIRLSVNFFSVSIKYLNRKKKRLESLEAFGLNLLESLGYRAVPKIVDPVFAKTSPNRSFSMTEYKRFGLIFTKTRVYKFGHWFLVLSLPYVRIMHNSLLMFAIVKVCSNPDLNYCSQHCRFLFILKKFHNKTSKMTWWFVKVKASGKCSS
jgi:hypothetical protein